MTALSTLPKLSPVQIHLKNADRDLISSEVHIREFFDAFLTRAHLEPYGALHVVCHGVDQESLGLSAFQLTQTFSLSLHVVDYQSEIYIQFLTRDDLDFENLALFAQNFFEAQSSELFIHH